MSELGDVLELLHGATGRVATLTATLHVWYDEERGVRAAEAAQQRAGPGAVAMTYHAGKGEPPQLRRYEQQTVVHYRHPGHYRLHRQANAHVHRPHDVLQIYDGEWEWTYVAADGEAYVQTAAGPVELVRLLDPSWLPAACVLSVVGRSSYEGRRVVELDGRPRPDPVELPLDRQAGWGADGLQVVLDAETGLLLSVTSRFDGEPYKVERLADVIVNQPLDDELFRFTPPQGVRVDDLGTGEHRGPPMRFRLRVLRQRLGRRSHVQHRL
jgi:outer membrane lipoprotein-sorting protein